MRSNVVVAEMIHAPKSRLDLQQLKVREVIDQHLAGYLVVPEFQREYVWKPGRAPRLIDSLYRGYPISMFLVWVSNSETRARRPDPRPILGKTVSWLIDGQQRLTTLSRILSGDEVDVVFNPQKEQFRLTSATTHRKSCWFRVSELLDDSAYRQIRRDLRQDARGDAWEARLDRVRRVLDYEIPVVRMIDHTFAEAVEAFSRINTLGMKLKMEDLESAHVAAKHSGFIADEVAPFVSNLRQRGYSRLSAMHLFRVCGFLAASDGRTRTPLRELGTPEITQAWTRTKEATEETLSILRWQFGMINLDLLWSAALLVPVIALCASSSSARDERAIAGWLAMAALLHRYRKGVESLDQDLRACRSDDPTGKLLSNARRDGRDLQATANDFKGKLFDRGALFGVYVACRHHGLRDVLTGLPIASPDSVERHYLLPRAQFAPSRRASADTLANIVFVNGETTRLAGATSPEVYLSKLDADTLASQCIPSDRSLWRIEKAEELWEARRTLLAARFNEFLRANLPGRRVG